jgi:malate dehydrogenase (oxaloacetate-decarboxylating)(NADP+)
MSDLTEKEKFQRKLALDYHQFPHAGKSELTPTKPCLTASDLSLAYSPGVAWPCREIHQDEKRSFQYTNRGNLVAVISNGTAVLGLGNIGASASKPVMEGKGVLFKRFADIDVFDLEVNETNVDKLVEIISSLEPSFGGVNLEDFKAPECFELERILKEKMNIPVFHDDQHGTAIIAAAAFVNAIEVAKKDIREVKIVFSGAGAAAIACARLFFELGVKREHLIMTDSKGVIYKGRQEGMNKYKDEFACETKHRTLKDALVGADAFMGCSMAGIMSKEMVASMADRPIIFAMANPTPEILPEEVAQVRQDAIMATGRSDYPNQVNNVLGFPFIFRGALDSQATTITKEMQLAAVNALSNLAKEEVPDEVSIAYGNEKFQFGANYLIPKPFDKRVLTRVAPAVARAAMESKVARKQIPDLNAYALELDDRLNNSSSFMRNIRLNQPKDQKIRLVFDDAHHPKVLRAISILKEEGHINPILLGRPEQILAQIDELDLPLLKDCEIVNPGRHELTSSYADIYFNQRQRKGVNRQYAIDTVKRSIYFGSMMVKQGDADGLITGLNWSYAKAFKCIMRVLDTNNKANTKAAGVVILIFKQKVLFLADCTAQANPSAQDLSYIAKSTADLYTQLTQKEPQIAFLSYSCFGSNRSAETKKVKMAVELTKQQFPELTVDGELQADAAVSEDLLQNHFPFSDLKKPANILVFPDLNSANISYKLLTQLGQATAIGPILTPMNYPINILQRAATVEEIVSMGHLTAIMAKNNAKS